MSVERIEYLMRLTHDHCDDGDEIATRQMQERTHHVKRTEELLALARGLVTLLEDDLQRFGRTIRHEPSEQRVPQQQQPPRISPVRKVEGANG
jgi:hypothetical protein